LPRAFSHDDAEVARTQWRMVAGQLRPKLPKLAGFLDEAETDVLAYTTLPPQRGPHYRLLTFGDVRRY
jgi:hypothetical protein